MAYKRNTTVFTVANVGAVPTWTSKMQTLKFIPTDSINATIASANTETVASSNTLAATAASAPKSNSAIIAITELDALCAKRQEWESTLYKQSNEQLYAILARCLDIYVLLSNDVPQRKVFRAKLDALKAEGVLTYNASTNLATRIVRYVFRSCGKRSFAYARTILAAHAAKVDSARLPLWIAERGGVEQVRRAANDGVTPSMHDTNMRELASNALAQSSAIASGIGPNAMLEPSADADNLFALALLRKEADGSISIVYGTSNASLINKFRSFAGKQLTSQQTENEKSEQRQNNDAQRDAVLQAA